MLEEWLQPFWTNTLYDDFVHKRLEGTCDWILDSPEFLAWQSPKPDQAKILWVYGPPGYGKTILCSRMIQHISSVSAGPLAYFFFSSELNPRADPFVVLRSLVTQIISQSDKAFGLAREEFTSAISRTASNMEIKRLFKAIIQNIPGCVFVVDGLDECPATDGTDYRGTLSSLLQCVRQAVSGGQSRVLVTSRDIQEIRNALDGNGNGPNKELIEL